MTKRIAIGGEGYGCILPDDIMEDILSRLHSKTLMEVRVVCKKWKSLISTRYFERLHKEKSLKYPNLLVLDCYYTRGYFLTTISLRTEEVLDQWDLPVHEGDCLTMLLSQWDSNPLVCFFANWRRFIICNPNVRKINFLPTQPGSENIDAYGFCYLPGMRRYVILSMSLDYRWQMITFSCSNNLKDLSTSGWKSIENNTPCKLKCLSEGVFVNGVLYWKAFTDSNNQCLLCFDLYQERFFSIVLSHEITGIVSRVYNLNGDLHLLMTGQNRTSMKLCRIGDVRNQTRIIHYTVDGADSGFVPLMVGEDGKMMITCDRFLEWYSLHDQVFRLTRKGDRSFENFPYLWIKLHTDTLNVTRL